MSTQPNFSTKAKTPRKRWPCAICLIACAVGSHVPLVEQDAAVICIGYARCGADDPSKLRRGSAGVPHTDDVCPGGATDVTD
jgi:hypothetical protein